MNRTHALRGARLYLILLVAFAAVMACVGCVPPRTSGTQVAGPLADCTGDVVTFLEGPAPSYGSQETCVIHPPQVLNLRMRPDAGAMDRCALVGGTWATSGAVWLCESVDYEVPAP